MKCNGNIGLYNLEPKINNSAMMQVSQYYKNKGYKVWEYHPLFDYDKIYAFSIFDFTDKSFVTDDMICGGTGFDVSSRLPKEIEKCDLDYSIFPNCDYSIIWFSRGCFRNCPFCIVRKKEGYIHPVEPKNLNPNGKYIKVMDNNFFGNPKWKDAINQLIEWNQLVDMQGIDIRIFNEEQGEALSNLRFYHNAIKFGWDNPKENLDDKIDLMLNYVKPYQLTCYILIGYWSTMEEDLYRINHITDKYGIDCFVMAYDIKNKYQNKMAKWCNDKRLFKKKTWEEYYGK